MPEFSVKEVRLPELHLPEIKRDDIVRSLSGVRMPEVDLAKARSASIKIPTMTVTASDIGKLVAAGAAMSRLARPGARRRRMPSLPFGRRDRMPALRMIQPRIGRSRRSRRPLVLLVVVAAAVALWAFLRRPTVRQRIETAARDARERFETMRTEERLDVEEDVPPTTAATPGSEAEGFADATGDAGSETPTAEGSTSTDDQVADGDGIPAFEEAGRPS